MASTAKQRSGLRRVSNLRRKLRRLEPEARGEAQEGVKDGADLVMFEQLRRVASHTQDGDLAASIEIKFGRDKLSAEIGPGARTKRAQRLAGWRAHFAEFGTRFASAFPFVFPSLESNRNLVILFISKGVEKAFKRVASRG